MRIYLVGPEAEEDAGRFSGTPASKPNFNYFWKNNIKTSFHKNRLMFLASLNKILLVERGEWELSGSSYDGLKVRKCSFHIR